MKKLRILITDDNVYFSDTFKLSLMDHHSEEIEEVVTATNGKECLDLLKNNNFDLIFMDINMPVMDGIETTRKVLERFPEITIIGVSYHNEMNYHRDLLDAGASDVYTKEELTKSKLRRLLGSLIRKKF